MTSLRRHWRVSTLAFVAVVALTVGVILLTPRVYRSEAKLLLRIGRESVALDPTANTGRDTLSLHQTRDNETQSALGVMRSREILKGVLDQVGVPTVLSGRLPSPTDAKGPGLIKRAVATARDVLGSIDPVSSHEQAMIQLADDIAIHAPADSSVVSITYQSDSAEVAQQVVAAWLDAYITHHAMVNRSQGTYGFLRDQGEMLRDQLEQARTGLQQTKDQSKLVTIEGQQKLIEAQLAKVRDSLIEVDSEAASLGTRVQSLKNLLANSDATVTEEVSGIANEGREQMRTHLFELEVQEKDLRSKYRPDHPKLVAIERQLAEAREIVSGMQQERKQVTRSASPAHQKLLEYQMLDQATLDGLLDKREALLVQQTALNQEIADLNATERRLAARSNEVAILEQRYLHHAQQLEQARMDEVLSQAKITSVNVVQPASLEQRPVTPHKPLCAIAGAIAACALALGLPILLDARHTQPAIARAKAERESEWRFDQREWMADDHPDGLSSDRITAAAPVTEQA